MKPEDLLVFDDTFGVVPKGVLEQLQKVESSSSNLLDSNKDSGVCANNLRLAGSSGGSSQEGKKKPGSKIIPPVRYSVES